MSPRTGRPKLEKSKKKLIQLRVDEETLNDLNYCAKRDNKTKSDIIREGIRLIKEKSSND